MEKVAERVSTASRLMMMIFYLFLHKQQIAYRSIPVRVHPEEIEENTCDDVAIMFLVVS